MAIELMPKPLHHKKSMVCKGPRLSHKNRHYVLAGNMLVGLQQQFSVDLSTQSSELSLRIAKVASEVLYELIATTVKQRNPTPYPLNATP